MLSMKAEPYDFEFDPKKTALVMIDFQRDFVYPGGFGESLKNGVRISFGPLVKDTAKIDEGLARLGTWMRGTQAP